MLFEPYVRLCCLNLMYVLYYWSFQGDTSVVVLFVLLFGVDFCAV